MREKKERRILNHVLQSTEDDKIVETMFCYVALLLEVFQVQCFCPPPPIATDLATQSGTNEMALVAITHVGHLIRAFDYGLTVCQAFGHSRATQFDELGRR